MIRRMALAALLFAAACGGQRAEPSEFLHQAAGVVDSGITPAGPRTAEFRILGVDGAAWAKAALKIAAVSVTAGGRSLDCKNGFTDIDLANPAEAWLLGKIVVPDGVEVLELRVKFAAKGAYERGDKKGDIAADCTEIAIPVSVKELSVRGHAVLHVDVERSLLAAGANRAFLPQVQLFY